MARDRILYTESFIWKLYHEEVLRNNVLVTNAASQVLLRAFDRWVQILVSSPSIAHNFSPALERPSLLFGLEGQIDGQGPTCVTYYPNQ